MKLFQPTCAPYCQAPCPAQHQVRDWVSAAAVLLLPCPCCCVAGTGVQRLVLDQGRLLKWVQVAAAAAGAPAAVWQLFLLLVLALEEQLMQLPCLLLLGRTDCPAVSQHMT